MPTLTRQIRSHQQNGPEDCGRACAQMVIGYVLDGAGSPAALAQQNQLALTENNANPNWNTDPDELLFMINQEVSPHTSVRWVVASFAATTETDVVPATANLLQSIRLTIDSQHPAIVAKGAADHWAVIWGYDDLPVWGGTALYQRDPLDGSAAGPPFVHASVDSCPQTLSQTIDYYPAVPSGVVAAPDYFIVDAPPPKWQDHAVALVTQRAMREDEHGDFTKMLAEKERRLRQFDRWWWIPAAA